MQIPDFLEEAQTEIGNRLKALVATIPIQAIETRIKTKASLERKLASPNRSYKNLSEVTDLLGFRIIAYSEDVIPEIAHAIEKTFDVDYANSVNKLVQDDSQKFGYRSLHYVCAIPGHSPYEFEIQIRTALQHTWAAIEHDIGYKADEPLPREFRRRFSQIASLLEIADREFAALRHEIKNYRIDLKDELDQVSLAKLLNTTEVTALDQQVADHLELPLNEEPYYPDYLLRSARAAGFKNIGELLKQSTSINDDFLRAYFEFAQKQWALAVTKVQRGYGLYFVALAQVLSNERLSIDKVNRVASFFKTLDELENAEAAAQSLITALQKT